MKKLFFPVIVFLLLSIGCSTVQQQVATHVPSGEYQELGESDCKKCGFLLFDLIPIRFGSMPQRAYDCVVERMGGNAVVSSSVQESWFFIPFVGTVRCMNLSGMVIKTQ